MKTSTPQALKAHAMAFNPTIPAPTTAPAPVTLAQWLELPVGWIAENYIATIELTWPCCLENNWNTQRATLPRPYDNRPRLWWVEQARAAL